MIKQIGPFLVTTNLEEDSILISMDGQSIKLKSGNLFDLEYVVKDLIRQKGHHEVSQTTVLRK